MSLTVVVPFPNAHLLPNSARRLHWRVCAEYAKPARMEGWVETLNVLGGREFVCGAFLPLDITFCEPNKRARDLDGMLSALKPTLDGVAEALEIDDKKFNPITLRRGDVVTGGQVILKIGG